MVTVFSITTHLMAVVMLLAMLQPVKGAVIAFLWWMGIGAFVKERRAAEPDDPA